MVSVLRSADSDEVSRVAKFQQLVIRASGQFRQGCICLETGFKARWPMDCTAVLDLVGFAPMLPMVPGP